MQTEAFMAYLEQEKQGILENCTQCGKCVEVCPMTAYTEVCDADPVQVVSQVIKLLDTGVSSPAAEAWIKSCAKSGSCIPACPEGVNPRKMLTLANLELKRHNAATEPLEARRAAQGNFKALREAIRLMLNVQLMPEEIERLLPGSIQQRQRPADVVFYFGCNILRTPDIALTVLDVLERLEVDCEVLGGTGNCCGITFMRAGDAADEAAAAGVDVLTDIYHACHRELAASEADYPFAIQNFISLIGEAMGTPREDVYKRMMIYRDLESIMAEAAPFIHANDADTDLVQLTLPKVLWGS